jgi:hypothetical protein
LEHNTRNREPIVRTNLKERIKNYLSLLKIYNLLGHVVFHPTKNYEEYHQNAAIKKVENQI